MFVFPIETGVLQKYLHQSLNKFYIIFFCNANKNCLCCVCIFKGNNCKILDNIVEFITMIELNSKQRKFLESEAHVLNPVVIVGSQGLSDGVVKKIADSLEVHELIKVKFNEFKDEKRSLTEKICSVTGSTLVRLIGNVAILFKQAENKENRRFDIEKKSVTL